MVNLLLGCWLITSENGVILGTQCWSVLLADWTLSRWSQVSLGEQKIHVVEPMCTCIHPIPVSMATFIHGQCQGRSGKEVDYYPQNGSLIYLINEVLLY